MNPKQKLSTYIKKRQKKTLKKVQKYSSDESSESDNLMLSDSNTSENWDTYCENLIQAEEESSHNDDISTKQGLTQSMYNIEQEKDQIIGGFYEPDSGQRRPQISDWIIVKFATKKSVKHFVGNVISLEHNIPQVKYLRKIKNSKMLSFHYPDVNDVSDLRHDEDVVKFLENPLISRRGHLVFKEHFEGFNIQ